MTTLEIPLTPVQTDFIPSAARVKFDAIKAAYLTWESQGFQIGDWIHGFEREGGCEDLGYDTMEALIKAEFPDRCYHTIVSQLQAARVRVIVDPEGKFGTYSRNSLRALHPFVDDPETAKQVFEEAQDENGHITEKRVQDVIHGTINGKGASRNGQGTSGKGTSGKGTSGRGTSRNKKNTAQKGTGPEANGPELTSSPKKAYATWEKFVSIVNNHYIWIREHGGILVHTKDWRPDQRTYVRENLRRFIADFEAWAAKLEEVKS